MTKDVVADDLRKEMERLQWKITSSIQEGALDPNKVCASLRSIIEGSDMTIDLADCRVTQAKVFWNAGFGRKLGYVTFRAYLKTIPEIPVWPEKWGDHFDRIVLVDRRPGITKMCRLLHVAYNGNNNTFIPFPLGLKAERVYWINYQDGRRNHDESPRVCRRSFFDFERGLSAQEGLAAYAQDRNVLQDHTMDLPGSICRDFYSYCAFLGIVDGVPRLDEGMDQFDHSGRGSTTCGMLAA